MQLQISQDQLKKTKLFIATPCYGGMMTGMTAKSFLDLQGVCNQYGMESRFSFIFNESLITRARNYLVDEFLRSNYTHLLFIDADIHFNPMDIIGCLSLDKDVIGAPYPKKSIKWNSVIQAINRRKQLIAETIAKNVEIQAAIDAANIQNAQITEASANTDVAAANTIPTLQQLLVDVPKLLPVPPELTPQELELTVGDYVFNAVAGTGQFNVGEPLEVMELGTGFMMIKRDVFLKWAAQYPEYRYRPDHVGQANFDGSRYIHAFFDTIIDRNENAPLIQAVTAKNAEIQNQIDEVNAKNHEITVNNEANVSVEGFVRTPLLDVPTLIPVPPVMAPGNSERYLSEDYFFCQMWRKMGGQIWLCPWMKTFHVGTYAFQGNMQAVAALVGSL